MPIRTDAGQLRTAVGQAEFDCVYDISAYQPEDVQSMVDLLRGRVGHYVFASSTVIYAAANVLPIIPSIAAKINGLRHQQARV